MKSFGVIGSGNMAQALVRGIHAKFPELEFFIFDPAFEKAQELAEAVDGTAYDSLDELINCDVSMLGMKPQHLEGFVADHGDKFEGKNLISLLTAVSRERLVSSLKTPHIVRLMPNTPSKIGEGVLLMNFPEGFKLQDEVANVFSACGLVEIVSEEQLDGLTIFSGSGPAYVFQFALYLHQLMLDRGIAEEQSRRIVNQLFVGSSTLMRESDEDLVDMIAKVTSKGGVTIEAVKVFREEAFGTFFDKALAAADQRNQELAAEINSLK